MKKGWRIFSNLFSVVLIASLMAVMIIYGNKKQQQAVCQGVRINITDSSTVRFIDSLTVLKLINSESLNPTGGIISNSNSFSIESLLRGNMYIDSVEVYYAMDNYLTVQLAQRHAIARIMTDTGYDFYVDSTMYSIKPVEGYSPKVPIISGELKFSFKNSFYGKIDKKNGGKDAENLQKLINFVQFVESDEFLSKLIVQVYVKQNGDIELVPRITDNLIVFGGLDDYKEKLNKLKLFYQNCFDDGFWKNSKIINVCYKDQVIVS